MSVQIPGLRIAEPYLIEQDWAAYSAGQHAIWAELVGRRMPQLETHACDEYLQGFEQIGLRADLIPDLVEVNRRLTPRSRWNATPVSGFLPAPAFFEMLAARRFPTTTWLRGRNSLEYTPEPDIFHDVFGHVPMHAHPVFADFLQHYGKVCAALTDGEALERMGRFFWFTVEFGVIRQKGSIRVYGSGLISSHQESTYAIAAARRFETSTWTKCCNSSFPPPKCKGSCTRLSLLNRSMRRPAKRSSGSFRDGTERLARRWQGRLSGFLSIIKAANSSYFHKH